MDASNCLGIHCFAEAHACIDLQKKAKDYALQYVVPRFIYFQSNILTHYYLKIKRSLCSGVGLKKKSVLLVIVIN